MFPLERTFYSTTPIFSVFRSSRIINSFAHMRIYANCENSFEPSLERIQISFNRHWLVILDKSTELNPLIPQRSLSTKANSIEFMAYKSFLKCHINSERRQTKLIKKIRESVSSEHEASTLLREPTTVLLSGMSFERRPLAKLKE